MEDTHADSALIDLHGGVTRVAQLLRTSVQRVHNWRKRGIPPAVKLEHMDLFGPRAASKANKRLAENASDASRA